MRSMTHTKSDLRIRDSSFLLGFFLLSLVIAPGQIRSLAQVSSITVKTLGGGPLVHQGPSFGFSDGNGIQNSQFNGPAGLAYDGAGGLFIADTTNNAVRRLEFPSTLTSTVLQDLPSPVDLHLDNSTNLYVLTQGDGRITKYDPDLLEATVVASGLRVPTAFTRDARGNFYLVEQAGQVKRVTPQGVILTLAQGLKNPQGIDVLDSGMIVVSDTDSHVIRILDPLSGVMSVLSGDGTPGFADGTPNRARFNRPHQIVKAPNGSILVADRLNHRVRLVSTNGLASTIYGISPSSWGECQGCFPGWADGTNKVAEAREPIGLAVSPNGVLFSTEAYYNLIRVIQGAPIQPVLDIGAGEGGTNSVTNVVTLIPPELLPRSGYYPMGKLLTISSTSQSVHYTVDGSIPTTNSPAIRMDENNRGVLRWTESLKDLTSLRLRAFEGTNSSTVVAGEPSRINELGVPSEVEGGVGATVVVPVVINLRSNDVLRSLQFRIEVTPDAPTTPRLVSNLKAISVSGTDFIKVVTTDRSGGGRSTFTTVADTVGSTRVLAVSFLGTNANFSIRDFAVVAMLGVSIPDTAKEGDRYRISFKAPSATSDGQQASVSLSPMPDSFIAVTNRAYLVGDTGIAHWYNSGDFGDGKLANDDVNNVFNASLGVRVPFEFSDLYNAMDVFPEDLPGSVGGDGQIRFLDWQTLLYRSLGFRGDSWQRTWSASGERVVITTQFPVGARLTTSELQQGSTLNPWRRHASVRAGHLTMISPGNVVDIPIYLKAYPGHQISGMQFRLSLQSSPDAPLLDRPMEFIPTTSLPSPVKIDGLPLSQVAVGWSLGSFDPPVSKETLLGYARFKVPNSAPKASYYTLWFLNVDGSPDAKTQYDFETIQGKAWILTPALHEASLIPMEWKEFFFGGLAASLQDKGDPDSDGHDNWSEYIAGTNPISANSHLRLVAAPSTGFGQYDLTWNSALGRLYQIETRGSLASQNWKPHGEPYMGNGDLRKVRVQSSADSPSDFYRIRVIP